jgi:hypothetical protein
MTPIAGAAQTASDATLVERAVRKAAAGQQATGPQFALKAVEVPDSSLCPREAEVLRRFAADTGPDEIAPAILISRPGATTWPAVTKLGARNSSRRGPDRCRTWRAYPVRQAVTAAAGCRLHSLGGAVCIDRSCGLPVPYQPASRADWRK